MPDTTGEQIAAVDEASKSELEKRLDALEARVKALEGKR